MVNATETYARWTHGLSYDDIPQGAIENAKVQFISILAAIYSGWHTAAGRSIVEAVKSWREGQESTVIGAGFKCSMRSAGLVNSVNAQVLEFEDWVGDVHTGATVVPAALAVAEAVGASGKELLTAQVAGNEVAARVAAATRGGRGTGNVHAVHQVEVPLVAGKLLGLSEVQLMDAVGGSCAQAQFPAVISWTAHAKGYLTGMPVYTGITAANVAQFGFNGNHEIVEHPVGYCYAAQGVLRPEELIRDLGEKWHLKDDLTTKRYPMCGFTLAAADALLELLNENPINAREVEEVVVRCPITLLASGAMFAAVPDMYDKIKNSSETGWSWIPLLFDAKYPIAAGLVDSEITPRQYTNERIFDPLIQETIRKVRLDTDASLDIALARHRKFGSEVTIVMKDGTKYKKFVEQHSGAPDNPFDVTEKFAMGTRDLMDGEQRDRIVSTILTLDSLDDVRELCDIL